jgi:DNA-binding IclR family transcriptional regulator
VHTLLGVDQAVKRLKSMFMEDPGTRISLLEASRLSGVDESTCDVILKTLEDAHFLKRRPDGLFIRWSD